MTEETLDIASDGGYDDIAQFLQSYIDEYQDFLSWIGTSVDDVGPGTMTMSIPYDQKLTNVRPATDTDRRPDIHGGIAATLIDTVGGLALRTELENPVDASIATINLNVNYLRPATGDLTATANVIRVGGTVGVSEVTVESTTPDGETKEVATGQGSYRVFRRED
ncbi:thioesterase superfamily protein [Natrialba chahannaoensis JCM 10990]|uniref:Thioesterase superfamily protein n=1 Tax=Natrialba chahannaoensis JCM 10990 TaxID=1227492 RepID=M0B661_9EURY|nr:PaaI family thioesterase [Natrialba chahannaoensis]ELZ06401.1 thioesterase superfamily protein [Natrialba chahannaoensis JCM 10990]